MKTNRRPRFSSSRIFGRLAVCAALLGPAARLHAITPDEWRYRQPLDVQSAGLMRIELPPETLGAARAGLEDLRVLDALGNEVPFLIERPAPTPGSVRRAGNFSCAIKNETTVITLETGTSQPIAGVDMETPASDFLKAVRVEGSQDGSTWQELAKDQPVFRLPRGAEKLRIPFAEGVWEFLRLTIDDRRAQPVPFTGAQLFTPGVPAPAKAVPVTIRTREENPGFTRLELDLGAANLSLASLRIETPEPLFTRTVTLAAPEVAESGIREREIGKAVIFKIGVGGANEAKLEIPIEQQIRSRVLILAVHNEDSPPLAITGVRAEQRPVRLVFFARGPGGYSLLAGNGRCPAARYDLSELGARLKNAAALELRPAALAENPDFKTPEILGALTPSGAPLDTAGWKFWKPVQLARPGAQQLELDTDVLACESADVRDLRLVRDGMQIPYLTDRPRISRVIAVNGSPVVDPKKPARSRWSIKLPRTAIPVTRLVCVSPSELFQRDMRLWEEISDERGEKYPRELGNAAWRQTPGHAAREFVMEIDRTPKTDTLFLDTDNGDNPPVELRDFRCCYPLIRLVFKTVPDAAKSLRLYYGNRDASSPRYDLSLVADEILRAEKSTATAGAEETATGAGSKRGADEAPYHGGVLFWGVLALVVVALLFVLAKFLPKQEPR